MFVGRDPERHWVQHWLTQPNAPTHVVFISGMGGIGKSTLMLQFLSMAQIADVSSVWIDGRICTETPAGFLHALKTFYMPKFKERAFNRTSTRDIINTLSKEKTVLCIDNYEYLQKIEGWLRGALFPQLSEQGLLVILASRQDFSFDWQNDLAWQDRVTRMQLFPLSQTEAFDFCRRRGLKKSSEISQVISATHGLPLAMALSTERRHVKSPASWSISMQISADLLREVATPDIQEIIDILCILPYATPQRLGRLLGASVTTMLLHQLSRLSFIRATAGGFALHDIARSYLIEDFLQRDPHRYQAMRRRIVRQLSNELNAAKGQEQRQVASLLLATYRDVFQLNSVPIVSTNPDLLRMEPFRQSDLPYLHEIMTEEAEHGLTPEAEHELLDALVEQFPESIQVLRSASGVPLAYTVGVLLYKDTVSFLESYLPGVLNAVFPGEVVEMQQLNLVEANTFYQLLTGVTPRESEHSWFESVGAIVVNMIMYHSEGLRVVIVTPYEPTNELLHNVGFRTRPLAGLPIGHPLTGASIHEQDWRGSNLADQVLHMLESLNGDVPSEEQARLSEADIKAALPVVDNVIALENSLLARKLRCSGSALQRTFQTLLFDKPEFPLDQRKQELLRLHSLLPYLRPEQAAERLHISRATYYRIRNEAMKDLKQILIERF